MFQAQKKRVAEEEVEARKLGLGIRLLPSSEEDKRRASEAKFRHKFDTNLRTKRALIQATSIFGPAPTAPLSVGVGGLKEVREVGRSKVMAVREVVLSQPKLGGGRMGESAIVPITRIGKDEGVRTKGRGEVTRERENERRLALVAKRRRMNPGGVLNLVTNGIQLSAMSR